MNRNRNNFIEIQSFCADFSRRDLLVLHVNLCLSVSHLTYTIHAFVRGQSKQFSGCCSEWIDLAYFSGYAQVNRKRNSFIEIQSFCPDFSRRDLLVLRMNLCLSVSHPTYTIHAFVRGRSKQFSGVRREESP